MAAEHFVVNNGVLKAASDLRREHLDEFCDAARSLLSEPEKELVVDLSKVDFMFSSFIGVLGNLSQDCHNIGKTLVVRLPERLAWVLDIDRNITMFMRIEKLEGNASKEKSATVNDSSIPATLDQNIPNPFSANTTINMHLTKAVLYIYTMQGKQIQKLNINELGNTSATIDGYSLKAGMYLYTLIADGKEVDTKKMILTK